MRFNSVSDQTFVFKNIPTSDAIAQNEIWFLFAKVWGH